MDALWKRVRSDLRIALGVVMLVVGVNLVVDSTGGWSSLVGGGMLGLFAGMALSR